MAVWSYALISVVLISLVSLIGLIGLSSNREFVKRISFFLVSFAVGGLLGDAYLHLLPESFEKLGINVRTSSYAIVGILIFFVMEKFLRWRHFHVSHDSTYIPQPVIAMNLIGDALHNFIDGVLVAASYMAAIPLGISTTVAVILHEIPQEIGDFAILVQAGLSVRKAILYNLISAMAAIAGALMALMIGSFLNTQMLLLVPVTAGGFVYIAGSDLIPALQQEVKLSNSLWQFVCILLGIFVMALLLLID